MIEKWPIFREVYRRGQVSGREATRKHYETIRRSTRSPLVVAPTIQMATDVCKLFELDPRKHAHGSAIATLRGLGSDTVFLLYYDAPWKNSVYNEVLDCIRASGGTIIMVPELQRVNRPMSVRLDGT